MSLPKTAWRPAYIGIGSNLDEPQRRVSEAFDRLAGLPETRLVAYSPRYRSAPFGGVPQPDFVNAAAALLTRLPPRDLLAALKELERKAGRQPDGPRWGPRELDLDLLVYSDEIIKLPDLEVPHPGIAGRNFVLLPLSDLAPDLVIPGLGRVGSLPIDEQEPRITRLD